MYFLNHFLSFCLEYLFLVPSSVLFGSQGAIFIVSHSEKLNAAFQIFTECLDHFQAFNFYDMTLNYGL